MGKLYPGPTSGIWTPALTFQTVGTVTPGTVTAEGDWYLRDGIVDLWFRYLAVTFTHSGTSNGLMMTGIPVALTAKTKSGWQWGGTLLSFRGITKAGYTQFSPYIAQADNRVFFTASGSGVTESQVVVADVPSASTKVIYGNIRYPIG